MRTGLIAAAIIGVAVLVVVGAFLAGLIGTTRDTSTPTGEGPSGGSVEMAVGGTASGTVPTDGTFEVVVEVTTPGTVVFDVRSLDDFDPVLELHDADGTMIDRNDDRDVTEERFLDPYLEVDLAPGTYTAVIAGFSGEGGSFELSVR